MLALESQGISKTYQNKTVLLPLDFTLREGSSLAIVGPRKSGKTTALKILAGMIAPTRGKCSAFDIPARETRNLYKICGVSTDDTNLFPFLSGVDNLILIASLYGIEKNAAHQKASELMKELGIWEKREQKLAEYTPDDRALLSIARALIHDPKILFYDQSGGEETEKSTRIIESFLRRQNEEKGLTLCVATSDPELAGTLCVEYAILESGKCLGVGSFEELLHEHPLPTYARFQSNSAIEGLTRHGTWYEQAIESREEFPNLLRKIVFGGADLFAAEIREPTFRELYEIILEENATEETHSQEAAYETVPKTIQ